MDAQVRKTDKQITAYGDFPAGLSAEVAVTHDLVVIHKDDVVLMQGPGSKSIKPDGRVLVTMVDPPLTYWEAQTLFDRQLRTTNATATEIFRFTTRNNTGYKLRVEIIAVDPATGDVGTIEQVYTFRNINGTITQVGATAVPVQQLTAGTAGWAVTPGVTGQDAWIRVTGAAGRSIDWQFEGRLKSFTPGGF